MPCFAASNVRFISAKEQQEYRAKTAPSISKQLKRGSTTVVQNKRTCVAQRRESQNEMRSMRMQGCKTPSAQSKPEKSQLRHAFRSKTAKLNLEELERLKSASKVLSVDERLELMERREKLSKQLEKHAERARLHFQEIDEKRLEAAVKKANKEAEEENLFGCVDNQKALEHNFLVKHEQEEEIKVVNRIILNAKCHAVRNAQVQEKRDIERKHKTEDRRIGKLMIEQAKKSLINEDCKADQKKIQNLKFAADVRKQMEHRQYIRLMEAERVQEEAIAQRKAVDAIKRDEERQARDARERRRKFGEELNDVIEMSNVFKKMLCEQELEADRRVAAYIREKREREKELEREKQRAKEELERKQKRSYELTQKITDSKEYRDELSYIREQERVEREYRRSVKEQAMRKKQLEQDIKNAQERQMKETKARQAIQLAREEKDFNILIAKLKKEEERLKKSDEERQRQRRLYRAEIMRQIGDKALAKRRLIEIERTEANIWREAEHKRLDNVRAIITAKLCAMRQACLPERYIREVERQLNRFLHTNPKKD